MKNGPPDFLWGLLAGIVTLMLILIGFGMAPYDVRVDVHAELCPAILAHAQTHADSLAVIEEHTGCWEFVHPPAPTEEDA